MSGCDGVVRGELVRCDERRWEDVREGRPVPGGQAVRPEALVVHVQPRPPVVPLRHVREVELESRGQGTWESGVR